jgi:hypothetical protein
MLLVQQLYTKCYIYSIKQNYLEELANAIVMRKTYPKKPFICTKNKEFIGSAMIPLMRLLLQIRDDSKLFLFLITSLHSQDEATLNSLAVDIIRNLFESFTSTEESVIKILEHMEQFIGELKVEGKSSVFKGNGFFDNLLNVFVNRAENKEYLVYLFKSVLEEIGQRTISIEVQTDTEDVEKDDSIRPTKELIQYCDRILDSIITKLNAMPIGIRYLMKMIYRKLKVRVY